MGIAPVGELSLTTHFMFDKLKNNHIVIDLDRLVVNRKLRCIMKEEKQHVMANITWLQAREPAVLILPNFPVSLC